MTVALSELERHLVRSGLLEWGGPADPTDDLALAMGFTDADSIAGEAWELWKRIEVGEALTAEDWKRVLLAVEIAFVSDVVGSGLDWPITSGMPDEQTITVLRGLQRKMPRWRESVQFTEDPSGHVDVADHERPAH